ncbi:MAG: SCO family protein, partial [Chloroflexota bacterium]|nr:SCO family protein [Chloroflexota bacterium]
GKEDHSIGTSVVPRNNGALYPNIDDRAYLYLIPVLGSLILFLAACIPTNNSYLHGTALRNHDGSSFSLQDENEVAVTDQTHIGEVYLVTFLFSNCTSLCPIVTSSIKQAINKSKSTKAIPVLIISVDPEGDTNESRFAFKNRWELQPNWSYLNGSKESLQSIWSDFYVNPHRSAIETLAGQAGRKYDVVHTSPVFIVGKDGRPAAVHTNPINPTHLYEDILTISDR